MGSFDAAYAEDTIDVPTPGKIREAGGVQYQHEGDFATMCEDRKRNNYNSGMGEIFRKVAEIAPIETCASLPEPAKIEEAPTKGQLSAAQIWLLVPKETRRTFQNMCFRFWLPRR